MQLQSGIGGGFALAQWPGVNGTNANASAQGPVTASQAGFGVQAGGGGGLDVRTTAVLSVGTLALAALVYLWWALPR